MSIRRSAYFRNIFPAHAVLTGDPGVHHALLMADTALIGSREACRILGIDRATLSRWVRSGRIHPVTRVCDKPNGAFLFRASDVRALSASHPS